MEPATILEDDSERDASVQIFTNSFWEETYFLNSCPLSRADTQIEEALLHGVFNQLF